MRFSISIPVGSYHPFLPHCLESLAQQRVNLDVALLDASDDERVKAVAKDYESLITYSRHGPDNGQSAAILEGWRNTGGDILGWLNADDMLFPDALEKAAKTFEREEKFDVVYGGSTIVDGDDSFTGYHWAVEPPSSRLLEAGIISQPSCFFKRNAHDSVGGIDVDLHYTMDWDLFIRLFRNGAKFGFIDEPMSKVLWGGDTKTSSFVKQRRKELRRIIGDYAPADKKRKIFRSFFIHHLVERIRPTLLQNLITRSLVRGRKTVNGLAADGAITDQAEITLVHYSKKKHTALKLFFRNPEAISQVTIEGVKHECYSTPGGIILYPESPIPAAKLTNIQIETAPEQTAWFERCEWADAEQDPAAAIRRVG